MAGVVAILAVIAIIVICGSPQTLFLRCGSDSGAAAEEPESIGDTAGSPTQISSERLTTSGDNNQTGLRDDEKDKQNSQNDQKTLIGTEANSEAGIGGNTEANPKTDMEEEAEFEPKPEPGPEYFTIAMMGDCALATEHNSKTKSNSYESVIGDNYAYPFSNVRDVYLEDDFVIVNLECAITEYNIPREKAYRLRADPKYVSILLEGGIHFAATGNNHTMDYGAQGYEETLQILEVNGVGFAPNGGWNLHTTDSGLVIGVYSKNFPSMADVKKGVGELRDAGAELIITALHWGDEGSYKANSDQKLVAHAAIDTGAHIVMGTHPHVLQEMEIYDGGYIWYSLANWTFGANFNPVDKDTVIAKVIVMRDTDGLISLVSAENIPCSISSVKTHNDYKPTPYEPNSPEYDRVMSKLAGIFAQPSPTPTPAPSANATEENQPSDESPNESPNESQSQD